MSTEPEQIPVSTEPEQIPPPAEQPPATPPVASEPGAQHAAEQKALAAQSLKEHGPAVKLNADGSVTCKACGYTFEFLPPTFPQAELDAGGAPRTANHTGCGKAVGSPAGAETVNVIDPAEVAEFYADKAAFAKKRGG